MVGTRQEKKGMEVVDFRELLARTHVSRNDSRNSRGRRKEMVRGNSPLLVSF